MANPQDDILEYTVFETDWGWMGVTCSPRGLVSLALPRLTAGDVLISLGVNNNNSRQATRFTELEKKLRQYLAGRQVTFDEPLDLVKATRFRRDVWLATQEIPYGESRSYAWIAVRIGNPKACRAVGQALGENPLPIVIPCHRVIASGGAIGGFSGGLETKRRLLKLEKTIV